MKTASNHGRPADVRDVVLVEARRLPGLDGEGAADDAIAREDRLDRAVDALDLDAEAGSDDPHRLREADVPEDRALLLPCGELLRREADPEAPQHRRAEAGQVDDPLDPQPVDRPGIAASR